MQIIDFLFPLLELLQLIKSYVAISLALAANSSRIHLYIKQHLAIVGD